MPFELARTLKKKVEHPELKQWMVRKSPVVTKDPDWSRDIGVWEASTGLKFQPPSHSQVQYLPTHAVGLNLLRFPMDKWPQVPTFSSTGTPASGSRGPSCEMAKQGAAGSRCHFKGYLPAFTWWHPDLVCSHATTAGWPTLLRYKANGECMACMYCFFATASCSLFKQKTQSTPGHTTTVNQLRAIGPVEKGTIEAIPKKATAQGSRKAVIDDSEAIKADAAANNVEGESEIDSIRGSPNTSKTASLPSARTSPLVSTAALPALGSSPLASTAPLSAVRDTPLASAAALPAVHRSPVASTTSPLASAALLPSPHIATVLSPDPPAPQRYVSGQKRPADSMESSQGIPRPAQKVAKVDKPLNISPNSSNLSETERWLQRTKGRITSSAASLPPTSRLAAPTPAVPAPELPRFPAAPFPDSSTAAATKMQVKPWDPSCITSSVDKLQTEVDRSFDVSKDVIDQTRSELQEYMNKCLTLFNTFDMHDRQVRAQSQRGITSINNELQGAIQATSKVSADCQQLQAQLSEAIAQNSWYSKQCKALRSSIANLEAAENELRTAFNASQQELAQANKMCAQKSDLVVGLEERLEDLQRANESSTRDILKGSELVQKEYDRAQAAVSENAALKAQLEVAQQELSRTQGELAEWKHKFEDLKEVAEATGALGLLNIPALPAPSNGEQNPGGISGDALGLSSELSKGQNLEPAAAHPSSQGQSTQITDAPSSSQENQAGLSTSQLSNAFGTVSTADATSTQPQSLEQTVEPSKAPDTGDSLPGGGHDNPPSEPQASADRLHSTVHESSLDHDITTTTADAFHGA